MTVDGEVADRVVTFSGPDSGPEIEVVELDCQKQNWGNWIVGTEDGRCRRWEMPKMEDELDCRQRRWEMPGFEIAGIRGWGIASVGLLRSQDVTPTSVRL